MTMDRWEKPPPPPRHRRNNPSFSSSLLDSIYRSIDESDGNLPCGAPDPTPTADKTRTISDIPVTRLHYYSTTSTSDSARTLPPPKPARSGRTLTRSDRIRSDPIPPPPPQPQIHPTTKSPTSIKKKLRDLKKPKSSSPVSPGAKLAGFLNSLFNASSHKKPKISSQDPSPSPSPSTSNCSTASSYSRSCLIKTPSTRGTSGLSNGVKRRSVRFSTVDEEWRPDGGMTALEMRRRRIVMEEMMKGFEMETEESDDDDDCESDGDLFELRDLGGSGRFIRDELPVYGTTNFQRIGRVI